MSQTYTVVRPVGQFSRTVLVSVATNLTIALGTKPEVKAESSRPVAIEPAGFDKVRVNGSVTAPSSDQDTESPVVSVVRSYSSTVATVRAGTTVIVERALNVTTESDAIDAQVYVKDCR